MPKFIALLRGINVSGQKIIRMADLKKTFERLSYTDIQTYLQSGNVVFESSASNPEKPAAAISAAIKKEHGFDVDVLVLRSGELRKVFESNPLSINDEKWLYVTFLFTPVKTSDFGKITLPARDGELAALHGRAIYLYCPFGYGTSKLNNNFFEKALAVSATTRNWRTATALIDLCNE